MLTIQVVAFLLFIGTCVLAWVLIHAEKPKELTKINPDDFLHPIFPPFDPEDFHDTDSW